MSRSRNIKPGFFKNDLLAECDPLARLLFAGLWCLADREGRLEDRPKKIKAECLPYDDCDCDALLDQLAGRGFIVRYVVDSVGYILIGEFKKHQNPHVKEQASTIPAPPTASQGNDMPGASTVQAPEIPERVGLIPDSLSLDSPSLIPDSKEKNSCASSTDEAPTRSDPIPYQSIVDMYNATMTLLPKARDLTTKRKTLIRSAWLASKARQDVRFWEGYFAVCADDKFLSGQGPYTNGHENWRPSFDYLLRADVVTRVFESAMDRMERDQ